MSKSSSFLSGNKLGLAAGLLASAAALQATRAANPVVSVYVDKSAPSGGGGSSWQDAFNDIQAALDALHSKVSGISPPPEYIVKVAQGTYKPDKGTKDRLAKYWTSLGASSAVSISLLGSFAGRTSATPDQQDFVSTRTIISGDLNGDDQPAFVNTADNSELLLVIDSFGSSIRLDSIDFRSANNTATSIFGYPTGVFPMSGVTLTDAYRSRPIVITNCSFAQNQSLRRGGALLPTSSTLTISGCTFRENRSESSGGAIWTPFYPTVHLDTTTFIGNVSGSAGGAVAIDNGTIDRCVFDSNVSGYQGGGFSGRNWEVTSSLFIRNHATVKGGAFAGVNSNIGSIRHCTLADNSAGGAGAFAHDGASVTMSDSIAWNNVSTKGTAIDLLMCTGVSTFGSNNLQGGIASVSSLPGKVTFGGMTTTTDPDFIRAASGSEDITPIGQLNYRLAWTSPAVGAITSAESAPLPLDLDGNLFPSLGHAADLGCYFNHSKTCLINLSLDVNGTVDDSDFSLFATAYDLMLIPDGANPSADFNRDGVINDADFSIFAVTYDRGMCQ